MVLGSHYVILSGCIYKSGLFTAIVATNLKVHLLAKLGSHKIQLKSDNYGVPILAEMIHTNFLKCSASKFYIFVLVLYVD